MRILRRVNNEPLMDFSVFCHKKKRWRRIWRKCVKAVLLCQWIGIHFCLRRELCSIYFMRTIFLRNCSHFSFGFVFKSMSWHWVWWKQCEYFRVMEVNYIDFLESLCWHNTRIFFCSLDKLPCGWLNCVLHVIHLMDFIYDTFPIAFW